MRTAIHRKSLNSLLPRRQLLNGKSKRKLKRIYRHSIENVRHYPLRSLGILTFGLGVISSLVLFYRFRK